MNELTTIFIAFLLIGCENTNEPNSNTDLLIPHIIRNYVTNDGITLRWVYEDTLKVMIEVQRKTENENYEQIALLTYSQYSLGDRYEFLDNSLENGIIAFYRIRANYGNNYGEFAYYLPVVKHRVEIVDTNFSDYNEFTAIKLANENILVVGKKYSEGYNSSIVYDPIGNIWSTKVYLPIYLSGFRINLLKTEQILLTGGTNSNTHSNKAYLYNSNENLWQEVTNMNYPHSNHSAIVSSAGSLFVLGGNLANSAYSNKCEIFDIQNNQWLNMDSLHISRSNHSSVLLPNEKILVSGGYSIDGSNALISSCEIYDIQGNFWEIAASMNVARVDHSALLLSDNRIMVVGCDNPYNLTRKCEMYDIQSNIWSPITDMTYTYVSHEATLLNDGRVIVIGDFGNLNNEKFNSEIYYPEKNLWVQTNLMPNIKQFRKSILLSNNKLAILGGEIENYLYLMDFN
jgi:hypothetical protein